MAQSNGAAPADPATRLIDGGGATTDRAEPCASTTDEHQAAQRAPTAALLSLQPLLTREHAREETGPLLLPCCARWQVAHRIPLLPS